MSNFNPFSLEGRRILVTGAASGIGRATSIMLSKLGAKLLLIDINREGLLETKQLCSTDDQILALDLVDFPKLKAEVSEMVLSFGKLNGVVHLAGKSYIAPLKSISEEKCFDVFTLNTYSALELAKLFINRNIYAGEKGSIVLVSSVYGIVGSPANVGYAMSKSALIGITKSLAMELAGKGIRVNCIAPGFVKTNMLNSASELFDASYAETLNRLHPLGIGEPDDVASSIAYLLSDAAKWVTGAVFNIDGGFTAQ